MAGSVVNSTFYLASTFVLYLQFSAPKSATAPSAKTLAVSCTDMRIWTKIIVVSIVLLLTAPFAFDMITVSSLTWTDIQRYGGLKIGVPLDTDKGFYLPIICNVSGTDSITI